MADGPSFPVPAFDVREYDERRAQWVALEYSHGDATLAELHEAHPELIPEPYFVNLWRHDYPAFEVMMRNAEKTRAQRFADDLTGIADTDDRQATDKKLSADVRKWAAARYDRDRYGQAPPVQHIGKQVNADVRVVAANLTDAQLSAIVEQALKGEGGETPGQGKASPEEKGRLDPTPRSSLPAPSSPSLTADAVKILEGEKISEGVEFDE